eukprot:IDg19042t1
MGRTNGAGATGLSPGRAGAMKPMKILRRPADAPPGARLAETGGAVVSAAAVAAANSTGANSVSASVAAEVASAVESALSRERSRLERLHAARQEAILRAV